MKYKNTRIKNIYYMLSYAFTALRQEEYAALAAEDFEHMHDLFAAILAKGVGRQLKQGLYRTYVPRTEELSTVRGRIDLSGTLHNRLARQCRITCAHDELSENNPFNQILKTTLLLLLRHAEVDPAYQSVLKKELLFFDCVDTIFPVHIRWQALRFDRNNDTYQLLMGLCQLVLQGMLLTEQDGSYHLANFLDEQRMERLYEKFLLAFYAQECPQLTASAAQIHWALDDDERTLLPTMQSDVTLSCGNRILIIDAKLYAHTLQTQYDVSTQHSTNLYQVFTYVKNKASQYASQPHQVAGMLLYAATDEAVQPNQSYRMSGNIISVRTLNLDHPFTEIAQALKNIATEFLGIP